MKKLEFEFKDYPEKSYSDLHEVGGKRNPLGQVQMWPNGKGCAITLYNVFPYPTDNGQFWADLVEGSLYDAKKELLRVQRMMNDSIEQEE